MNRLRQLFAAALAAGMLAFAPPTLAQDDAPADDAAEQVDAGDDAAAAEDGATDEAGDATGEEAAGDEAADTGAPAADDPDAAMADAEVEETPSPWSGGLMMSITAMCIGGFSAVLGIWVDRDTSRPTVFAYSMSFLILCALTVGVAQAYLDEVDGIKKDQDLERMLDMTFEIAKSSGDPELIALVEESSGVKIEVEPAPAPPAEEPPAEGGDEAVEDGAEGAEGDAPAGDEAAGDEPAGEPAE